MNEMEAWHGRPVEAAYFTAADAVRAVLAASAIPKARAVASAIGDWYRRRDELESKGESVTCMCCHKDIRRKTMVGGFMIMVPIDVGGFDAANPVNCLVGAVCHSCDADLGSDEGRIMAKAMPGGAMHIAPGSERTQ